jgi:hypothetical protein
MIRSSYSVLMRAVVALRVTTMGNRGSKNQLPRALVAASPKRQVPAIPRCDRVGKVRRRAG